MARLTNPYPQYIDVDAENLAGAELNFYTTGTLNRKDTFSVEALTVGFENANPVICDARAEVERLGRAGLDGANGLSVGLGQVFNVDIVTDAGAVGRVVIVAENGKGRARSGGGEQRERDQVGFRVMVFTNPAVRGGTGRVEVTQRNAAQTVGHGRIGQDLLDHPLRAAVRAQRRFGQRYRDLGDR